MILDAIIGLFVSIFQASTAIIFPVINLVLAGVEAVIGLFVSGFELGRLKRNPGRGADAGRQVARDRRWRIAFVLVLLIVAGVALVGPKVMNRKVTLVAEDGHSLPFAAMVVNTAGGTRHERTDNAGNLVVPRFTTESITVKDPRYVEKTWRKPEFAPELIVTRTRLGAGLDALADRLLQPAGD